MLCLNMKLASRLKGDKSRGQDRGAPSTLGGLALGGLGVGALGSVPRDATLLGAALAGHHRDRSKSLCVDRVMAALVRPGYDPATLAARDLNLHNIQRRRASSAM
ncbi:hypothetical protein ONE63_004029 [Megalurothrips usitatus]|uniref:Uncharacterized protein n=1 Tax=Megalurothrips usitatus TaxID=439358 RepID=A0AAV7X8B9_9NEOP|nr:hypothetical protein ONE63_004029 [Megalurothrips usitatus]